MKKIAVIPARYAATRFPGKLMQQLGDKTVIRMTYENVVATNLFDDVFVVTDSDLIFDEIVSHNGKAIMSIKDHETGSDRIAEAIQDIECDIILNVQGDEPFVNEKALADILSSFDGEMGKCLVNNHIYDLIITDVILPHINGFELCKEIRAVQPEIPIIMLTALGTTDDKLDGFDSVADDW